MKLNSVTARFALLAIWLAPFIAVELSLQFIYRHDLRLRSWAWSWLLSESLIAQTAPANTNQLFDSRWAGTAEQRPGRGHVRFRTDRYGSIVPSTLTAAMQPPAHSYVVFCGGSTTESGVVSEGHRPADVFARLRDVSAVNFGRSGKSIDGCIASLQDLLRLSLPRPKLVVVANNVNTLMDFSIQQIYRQSSNQNGVSVSKVTSEDISLKSRLHQFFPGILHAALKAKVAIGPFAELEYGLKMGCCHGASEVNRDASNFDWYSTDVQEDFAEFVIKRTLLLAQLLDELKFSKDRLIIFIEPNSFAFNKLTSGPDYRQRLRNLDGSLMSFSESSRVTAHYDRIYAEAFLSQGFTVLQMPLGSLDDDFFYDAVHLTAQGAKGVGEFYADKLP